MNLLQSLAGYMTANHRAGAKREDNGCSVSAVVPYISDGAYNRDKLICRGTFDACVLDIRKDEVYTIVPPRWNQPAGPVRNRRLIAK